jgi:hypothetical protein
MKNVRNVSIKGSGYRIQTCVDLKIILNGSSISGMGHKFDDLVQDRDRWRAIVNAGMKTSCSIKLGDFFTN